MDFKPRFLEGVERFNARRFWDAHESWEELWLAAETDLAEFLQGLIQIAAAYHHVQRGTLRGGVRLFEAGLRRLSAYPAWYCGVDRSQVEEAAQRHRRWAADTLEAVRDARTFDDTYPRLELLDDDVSPIPPHEPW